MLTLKRLERSEAKVSRYVLMGRGCSNVVLLPTYEHIYTNMPDYDNNQTHLFII